MKDVVRPRRKSFATARTHRGVNDTDIMLAAYDERMRGAAGFVAEEPETVLIGLAGDLATTSVLPEGGAGDLAGAADRQPPGRCQLLKPIPQ